MMTRDNVKVVEGDAGGLKMKNSYVTRIGNRVLLLGILCAVSACDRAPTPTPAVSSASSPAPVAEKSYLDRRASFKTKLTHEGPSPQRFQAEAPPPGVQEIIYHSGPLALKAWVAFPETASRDARVPGVVFFHGGFAFGASDFRDARPFLDAGLAVMCPTLRGENGNPGSFEMYLGEVEDAKAAISWFSAQEKVDPSHIYTFGHSAGGVISALLSLHDVSIRHGGSSGGLYGISLFDHMSQENPFANDDPSERKMRVLVGNIKWMRHPHYAFVGAEDGLQEVAEARKEIEQGQPLLKVIQGPGNHFTSLAPAVKAYAQLIKDNP